MSSILHIRSSSNLDQAVTRGLGDELIRGLIKADPQALVTVRDLVEEPLPHVSPEFVTSLAKPDAPIFALSNKLVDELLAADTLVIEAPMYNFSVPSSLKAWIDHVCRAGRTFQYTAEGPVGLLKNKRVIFVLARGGIYSDGPFKSFEMHESYLRNIFTFLGLSDFKTVLAEGIAYGPEVAAKARETAEAAIADIEKVYAGAR